MRWLLGIALLLLCAASGRAVAETAALVSARSGAANATLLFSWGEPTTGRIAQAGRTLRLSFSRPVAGDLTAALAQLHGWLRDLRATGQPGEVLAELDEGVRATPRFPTTGMIALMLSRAADPGAASSDRLLPRPGLTAPTGRHRGSARLALDSAAPLEPRTARDGDRLEIAVAPGTARRADRGDPNKLVLDRTAEKPAERRNPPASPPVPVRRTKAPSAIPQRAIPQRTASRTAAQSTNESWSHADSQGDTRPPPAGKPATTAEGSPPAQPEALRLRWRVPVSAAIFERAGVLWLAFGAPRRDLVERRGPDPALWIELEPILQPKLTVFRFRRASLEPLRAFRDGATWRIETMPLTDRSDSGVSVREQDHRLVFDATGQLQAATDPESGERLHLLLTETADRRQTAPRSWVDLEVLPTLAGLAWRTFADGVDASLSDGHLALSRSGGLRLGGISRADTKATDDSTPGPSRSAVETEQPPRIVAPASPTDTVAAARPAELPIAPLALAGLAKGEPLARRRAALRASLPELSGATVVQARSDLARLFIADALGAEAQAVLDADPRASAKESSSGQDRQALLRAASQLLLGRPRAASQLLLSAPGPTDAERALWQAVADAGLEDWERADKALQAAGRVLNDYPPRLKVRLGLTAARILAEAGRIDPALALIDSLTSAPATSSERAELELVKGIVLARDADGRGAAPALARAAREGDLTTRVAARFATTMIARQQGKLTPANTLRELSEQRRLWRGHPDEVRMLSALADLQRAQGDPVGALDSWQAALARYPGDGTGNGILTRMRATLAAAIAGDDRPATDPISAYALYRSYQSLLAGETGAMIQSLARRLAAAGLPELAGRLLADCPSANPACGESRADLASYRLQAGDPAGALAGLGETGGDKTEALLRAHALLALARPEDALNQLAGDNDPAGSTVRADALWQLGAWQQLGAMPVETPAARGQDDIVIQRMALAQAIVVGPNAGPAGTRSLASSDQKMGLVAMVQTTTPVTGAIGPAIASLGDRLLTLRSELDADHAR